MAAPMPAPPPVTRARWPSSESLTAPSIVSGADLMPEITDDPLCTTGPATSSRRHRSATPSSTTDSSRRASAAPRQKCGPWPRATWWFGVRPTSKVPAVGPNSASSRLAAA